STSGERRPCPRRRNCLPAPATEPSARARELVGGAYDLHVHVEPDLARRRIDDLGLARRFAELGLAGFVLKSHYVPTAERAAVVRASVPGVDVLGAITLNAGVGGLNAQAVEIAARGGARVVWLPTVDSENEAGEEGPKPAKQPVWRAIHDEFVAAGVAGGPVPVTAPVLAPVLGRCFAPIHSGKVSWEETFAAIRATGPERNVLSTDLGQLANPPVEDGL